MNEPNNPTADQQPLLVEKLTATESLADLPLTDAHAEAAKGGGGSAATAGQFPYQVSLRTA